VLDREHIEVAVERQMAPGATRLEARNDVGHRWLRCDEPVGKTVSVEKPADVSGGIARVARWVGAAAANEFLQELDQQVAVAVDAVEKLLLGGVHVGFNPSNKRGLWPCRSHGRPRRARRPGGEWCALRYCSVSFPNGTSSGFA